MDALRGVALGGILIANMRGFSSPMPAYLQPYAFWHAPVDRAVQFLIDVFVSGKFLTIFAVLFGAGFAAQLERAAVQGEALRGVYLRRMLWLALCGAAHVALLWWGDILLPYAVMGLLLPAFRKRSEDGIMFWCQMLYWLPAAAYVVFALLGAGAGWASEAAPPHVGEISRAGAAYAGADFTAMLRQRLTDWLDFNAGFPVILPRILACFLFGCWLWRRRVFQRPEEHGERLRRWAPWFLAVGLAGNLVSAGISAAFQPDPAAPSALGAAWWLSSSVGVPALSLFYGSAVLLAFQIPSMRRALSPFRAAGRTALTNYLLESAVCIWIFSGFGLGYFGRVGPLGGLALAAGIYAGQVGLSLLWLRAFRYGPMEWLWRSLTYGAFQPMRREST